MTSNDAESTNLKRHIVTLRLEGAPAGYRREAFIADRISKTPTFWTFLRDGKAVGYAATEHIVSIEIKPDKS